MRILADTHTHTNVSAHAYSTLRENAEAAARAGLELIAMTNHAPAMPDSAHVWHFQNMHLIPKEIAGVKIMTGAEVNVLDADGNIDLSPADLTFADVVIASLHRPVYIPGTIETHTKTWLNVIKNPYVDIIGHSGEEHFKYGYETVIAAAKAANKCIEINNSSFVVRAKSNSPVNCREIASICKRLGAPIVVSSDAHIAGRVGDYSHALGMLEDINFPEELIMNTTAQKFIQYIEKRKKCRGDY